MTGEMIPTDVPGTVPESTKLPPFLDAQIRQREAYLTLLRDLNSTLGSDWSNIPSEKIKQRINEAIGKSLGMWI